MFNISTLFLFPLVDIISFRRLWARHIHRLCNNTNNLQYQSFRIEDDTSTSLYFIVSFYVYEFNIDFLKRRWILFIPPVHDNTDASISEDVKDSN